MVGGLEDDGAGAGEGAALDRDVRGAASGGRGGGQAGRERLHPPGGVAVDVDDAGEDGAGEVERGRVGGQVVLDRRVAPELVPAPPGPHDAVEPVVHHVQGAALDDVLLAAVAVDVVEGEDAVGGVLDVRGDLLLRLGEELEHLLVDERGEAEVLRGLAPPVEDAGGGELAVRALDVEAVLDNLRGDGAGDLAEGRAAGEGDVVLLGVDGLQVVALPALVVLGDLEAVDASVVGAVAQAGRGVVRQEERLEDDLQVPARVVEPDLPLDLGGVGAVAALRAAEALGDAVLEDVGRRKEDALVVQVEARGAVVEGDHIAGGHPLAVIAARRSVRSGGAGEDGAAGDVVAVPGVGAHGDPEAERHVHAAADDRDGGREGPVARDVVRALEGGEEHVRPFVVDRADAGVEVVAGERVDHADGAGPAEGVRADRLVDRAGAAAHRDGRLLVVDALGVHLEQAAVLRVEGLLDDAGGRDEATAAGVLEHHEGPDGSGAGAVQVLRDDAHLGEAEGVVEGVAQGEARAVQDVLQDFEPLLPAAGADVDVEALQVDGGEVLLGVLAEDVVPAVEVGVHVLQAHRADLRERLGDEGADGDHPALVLGPVEVDVAEVADVVAGDDADRAVVDELLLVAVRGDVARPDWRHGGAGDRREDDLVLHRVRGEELLPVALLDVHGRGGDGRVVGDVDEDDLQGGLDDRGEDVGLLPLEDEAAGDEAADLHGIGGAEGARPVLVDGDAVGGPVLLLDGLAVFLVVRHAIFPIC